LKANALLPNDDLLELRAFASRGFKLRSNLLSWEETVRHSKVQGSTEYEMQISWVFYSAISIFLSGVFDYSTTWTMNGISAPTLSEVEIQQHVQKMLTASTVALKTSNLSALLFLFPLRIAGARAVNIEQRTQIQGLLAEIACNFKAAEAFISQLRALWADPASRCNNIHILFDEGDPVYLHL
jgi:hypothetical protein